MKTILGVAPVTAVRAVTVALAMDTAVRAVTVALAMDTAVRAVTVAPAMGMAVRAVTVLPVSDPAIRLDTPVPATLMARPQRPLRRPQPPRRGRILQCTGHLPLDQEISRRSTS
jgi:hypothetical protein